MGLVEAVGGEAAELTEDLLGHVPPDAARHRLFDEGAADLVHLLQGALVSHGATQHVAFGEAEAGDRRGYFDDLLLVDDDTVSATQDRRHSRVRHGDRFALVPSPDERSDHFGLQRSGPEERDGRDDVFEVTLPQAAGQVALSGALELEHADRTRRPYEFVDLGVVAREFPGLEVPACARLDAPYRFGDGRVHLEGEDVHLDETERLDVVLVELGHHDALGGPLQRHAVGERLAREDEPAQVRTEVGGEVVQALGQTDEPLVVRVLELVGGKLGPLGEHLPELGGAAPRDTPGQAVDLVRCESEGAAHDSHG